MTIDRMSPLDATFLHIEDGISHMHIGSCALMEAGPAVRRPRHADREQAAVDPALSPAGAVRTRRDGTPGVGRRSALPARLPRAPHGAAAARDRAGPAQPDGAGDVPTARPQPSTVGDLDRRRTRRRHLGVDHQGPSLHGRRDLGNRSDGGRARSRARRVPPGGRRLDAVPGADRRRAAPRRRRRDAVDPGGDGSMGAIADPSTAAGRSRARRRGAGRVVAWANGCVRTSSCRSRGRSDRTGDGRGRGRRWTTSRRCGPASVEPSTTSC